MWLWVVEDGGDEEFSREEELVGHHRQTAHGATLPGTPATDQRSGTFIAAEITQQLTVTGTRVTPKHDCHCWSSAPDTGFGLLYTAVCTVLLVCPMCYTCPLSGNYAVRTWASTTECWQTPLDVGNEHHMMGIHCLNRPV